MPLDAGTIIEGYEIIEIIGTGAMSTVYLAKKDSKSCAVKELKSDFSSPEEEKILLNAFQRETELLFHIEHPGMPRYYRRFKCGGKSYIVMEYIKGISLEEIIKGLSGPFDEQKALRLAIQICEILCYLHNLSPEPVIYRDLKPSNIIISEGDTVRLIDFGVARRYDPSKDCDTVRLGTPGYAAPEQCRKNGQSVPQSDIYALGVVLHQLLTLYDPSVTPFKLPAVRKLNQKVSEELEYLINKAINLDRRDGYIDTGLFRDELVDYYEGNFGFFISPYKENLPYMKGRNMLIPVSSLYAEIPDERPCPRIIKPFLSFYSDFLDFFWEPISIVRPRITSIFELITLFRQTPVTGKIAIIWIGFILWTGFAHCLTHSDFETICKVIQQVFALILIPLIYLIIMCIRYLD